MTKEEVLSSVKDYASITLGLLLYTMAYTLFILPYQIVTGGVAGIGAIIYYATGFPLQYTYFIINGFLILASLKILGWKFLIRTIYATVMITFLLSAAQELVTMDNGSFYKVLGEGNDFMSLIIGCTMTGTALAVVFLNNGSTGGSDIIAACVNKYHNISLGKVLIYVDFVIVMSCLFVDSLGSIDVRFQKVVFGMCTIFIECSVIDLVINYQRQSVQFLIFSKKSQELALALANDTDHSITLLNAEGWFSGEHQQVICLIAKRSESVQIFRLIKEIDEQAFVSQSYVLGVYGEGFDAIKVKTKKKKTDDYSLRNQQPS